jgi:SAM-dependent methyltransferase
MSGFLENSISPAAPFDAIAESYDAIFSDSPIGRSQRKAVWTEIDRVFFPGHRVLEINCGTGIDAVRMASRGIRVVGCDSAPAMVAVAEKRAASLRDFNVRFQCLRTEDIDDVAPDGPYDGVLSNFSGLNCISNLQPVARSLAELVRPGGRLVVCVFGRLCLWEVLWYAFSEKREKAFRRLRRDGVTSNLGPGVSVTVRYWSVKSLKEVFAPHFRLERRRGIGVVTPPSYAGSVPARFPRLFNTAVKIDRVAGSCPGVRALADHVVLIFERMGAAS